MKTQLSIFILLFSVSAFAMKFSFQNEELSKMLEVYSKETGQKFVLDPTVNGRATILSADDVSKEEAFNLLSSSLATNGFAITKQGDTFLVKPVRSIQRDLIEVSETLPALKPERMVAYVYTFKNISAAETIRDLRILASKDGEVQAHPARNQIIVTDWVSNIHRIDQLFRKIDIPKNSKLKLVKPIYEDHPAFRDKNKKTDPGAEKTQSQGSN